MKSNRSAFWKGFAVGGLLFGVLGAVCLNQFMRLQNAIQALGAASNSSAFQQARLEEGLVEQAINVNRLHAWGDFRSARMHNCMSEQLWLLWPNKPLEQCIPGYTGGDATFFDEIPEGWEPIGIERAREHIRRMKAKNQASGTPEGT